MENFKPSPFFSEEEIRRISKLQLQAKSKEVEEKLNFIDIFNIPRSLESFVAFDSSN